MEGPSDWEKGATRALGVAALVAVAIALLAAIHLYLWARLVRETALPSPWSLGAAIALAALAACVPASLVASHLTPRARALAWLGYGWLGLAFVLLVLVGAADLARLAILLAAQTAGAPLDPDQRLLLSRLLGGLAVGLSGLEAAWGLRVALRQVALREVTVHLHRLPRALDGTTIAMICDVHLGPTVGAAFLSDVVERVNALRPDLVAIVGDLVDGPVDELGPAIAPLRALQAHYGAFFVTGNHEYYSGVDGWLAEVSKLGVRVLRNERVSIGEGEGSFDLAGTDDLSARFHGHGHGEDLARALEGRDPARELVLLAHQPRTFQRASKRGIGLQLSGHTHGGQIWPFGYLVWLQQGYLAGLVREGEAQLYVSRGTGYWGPPMRLGAPAEITRIVLRAE